jgi:hypothetical protein
VVVNPSSLGTGMGAWLDHGEERALAAVGSISSSPGCGIRLGLRLGVCEWPGVGGVQGGLRDVRGF